MAQCFPKFPDHRTLFSYKTYKYSSLGQVALNIIIFNSSIFFSIMKQRVKTLFSNVNGPRSCKQVSQGLVKSLRLASQWQLSATSVSSMLGYQSDSPEVSTAPIFFSLSSDLTEFRKERKFSVTCICTRAMGIPLIVFFYSKESYFLLKKKKSNLCRLQYFMKGHSLGITKAGCAGYLLLYNVA